MSGFSNPGINPSPQPVPVSPPEAVIYSSTNHYHEGVPIVSSVFNQDKTPLRTLSTPKYTSQHSRLIAQDPVITNASSRLPKVSRLQNPVTSISLAQDPNITMSRVPNGSTPRPQDRKMATPRPQDRHITLSRAPNESMPRTQDPNLVVSRAPKASTPRIQDPNIAISRAPNGTMNRAQVPNNLSSFPAPFVFLGPDSPTIFYPKKLLFRPPGETPLRFPPGVLLPKTAQQSQSSRQIRPSQHQQSQRHSYPQQTGRFSNPQQPTRPSYQQPQRMSNPQSTPRMSNPGHTPRMSNPQSAPRMSNPQHTPRMSNPKHTPRISNYQQPPRMSYPQRTIRLSKPQQKRLSNPQRPCLQSSITLHTVAPNDQQFPSFQNLNHHQVPTPSPSPHRQNFQPTQQGQGHLQPRMITIPKTPQSYHDQRSEDIPEYIKKELSERPHTAGADLSPCSTVPFNSRILPPQVLNNPSIIKKMEEREALDMNHNMDTDDLQLGGSEDEEQFHLIKTGQELARMCFAVDAACQTDLSFPIDKDLVVMPMEDIDFITAPDDEKQKSPQAQPKKVFESGAGEAETITAICAEADDNETISSIDGELAPALKGDPFLNQGNQGFENKDPVVLPEIKESFKENKTKDFNIRMSPHDQIKIEGSQSHNLRMNDTNSLKLPLLLGSSPILDHNYSIKEDSEVVSQKIIKSYSKGDLEKAVSCKGDLEKIEDLNPLANFASLISSTDPSMETELSKLHVDASTSASGQSSLSKKHCYHEEDKLANLNSNVSDNSSLKSLECVEDVPVESRDTNEQYTNLIENANFQNDANSCEQGQRFMKNEDLVKCPRTSNGFFTDFEDPEPSTSKKPCHSQFTKSCFESPMERLKSREMSSNQKPDVGTRMSLNQFEERSRKLSETLSKSWNQPPAEISSATERRGYIPGIKSLKKENVPIGLTEGPVKYDTVKTNPVINHKESLIMDAEKISPVGTKKEPRIQLKFSPVNDKGNTLDSEAEKDVAVRNQESKSKSKIQETNGDESQNESIIMDLVSPLKNEKESVIDEHKASSVKNILIESIIENLIASAVIGGNPKESVIKKTNTSNQIRIQKESRICVHSLIENLIDSLVMVVSEKESNIDVEETCQIQMLDESVIKKKILSNPIVIQKETNIADLPISTPVSIQKESGINDTDKLNINKIKIVETHSRIQENIWNNSPIQESIWNNSRIQENIWNNSRIQESIWNTTDIIPVIPPRKSVIKALVKTSPIRIKKEVLMEKMEKRNSVITGKESVVNDKEDINPVFIQEVSLISDTEQNSPVTRRKEILKNDTENTIPIKIQKDSFTNDTEKNSPVTVQKEIKKESFKNDTEDSSPFKIHETSVIDTIQQSSVKAELKSGIGDKETTSIGIKNDFVINIDDYRIDTDFFETQEKRSSRGRLIKKRKFEDYNDYDESATSSNDEENHSDRSFDNHSDPKQEVNKVIPSANKRNDQGVCSGKNSVKDIGDKMFQKSPLMIMSVIAPENDVNRNIRDLDEEHTWEKSIPKTKSQKLMKANNVNEKSGCQRGDRILRSASKRNVQLISTEGKKTKQITEDKGKCKSPLHDQNQSLQDKAKDGKKKSGTTEQLQSVFDEIMKDPASSEFYYQVNELRPMPRYYVIENLEIDLKTVELKLENNLYANVEEFLQDFRSIAKTSLGYFGPSHKITKKSENLLELACGLISRRNLLKSVNTDPVNAEVTKPINRGLKRKTAEVTEKTPKKVRQEPTGVVCEKCGSKFAYWKGYTRHSKSKTACPAALKRKEDFPSTIRKIDHSKNLEDQLNIPKKWEENPNAFTKFADHQNAVLKMEENPTTLNKVIIVEDDEINNEGMFDPPSPAAASSLHPLSRRKRLPKKNASAVPLLARGIPVSHPQDTIVIDADDDNFEPPGLLVRSFVDAIANTTLPPN